MQSLKEEIGVVLDEVGLPECFEQEAGWQYYGPHF